MSIAISGSSTGTVATTLQHQLKQKEQCGEAVQEEVCGKKLRQVKQCREKQT
jgi:hypothetical protein